MAIFFFLSHLYSEQYTHAADHGYIVVQHPKMGKKMESQAGYLRKGRICFMSAEFKGRSAKE